MAREHTLRDDCGLCFESATFYKQLWEERKMPVSGCGTNLKHGYLPYFNLLPEMMTKLLGINARSTRYYIVSFSSTPPSLLGAVHHVAMFHHAVVPNGGVGGCYADKRSLGASQRQHTHVIRYDTEFRGLP